MDFSKTDIIPLKRRGGRTSRRAMKKNKKNFQKYVGNNIPTLIPATKAKDVDGIINIPLPPTPAIDESQQYLCSNEAEKCEKQMACENPSGDQKESHEISGPLDDHIQEGIDGGLLCFDDIGLLEYGVLNLNEGRESNDVVMGFSEDGDRSGGFMCTKKVAAASEEMMMVSENLSSNIGDDWGWEEGVLQGNEKWDNEIEERLSLLWESDNLEGDIDCKLGEIDFNKQDAILAWLLS